MTHTFHTTKWKWTSKSTTLPSFHRWLPCPQCESKLVSAQTPTGLRVDRVSTNTWGYCLSLHPAANNGQETNLHSAWTNNDVPRGAAAAVKNKFWRTCQKCSKSTFSFLSLSYTSELTVQAKRQFFSQLLRSRSLLN